MNMNDKVEVGHVLAQAGILKLDSSPELLGAIGLPQYMYTLYAQREWHPERGATTECRSEETLSRGSLHGFHVAMGVDVKRCHI